MRRFKSFKSTLIASFGGYVVQGIVNTFVPLLFITFQNEYGIPLSKITALITINFLLQLCVDLASAFFIDKIAPARFSQTYSRQSDWRFSPFCRAFCPIRLSACCFPYSFTQSAADYWKWW